MKNLTNLPKKFCEFWPRPHVMHIYLVGTCHLFQNENLATHLTFSSSFSPFRSWLESAGTREQMLDSRHSGLRRTWKSWTLRTIAAGPRRQQITPRTTNLTESRKHNFTNCNCCALYIHTVVPYLLNIVKISTSMVLQDSSVTTVQKCAKYVKLLLIFSCGIYLIEIQIYNQN